MHALLQEGGALDRSRVDDFVYCPRLAQKNRGRL